MCRSKYFKTGAMSYVGEWQLNRYMHRVRVTVTKLRPSMVSKFNTDRDRDPKK